MQESKERTAWRGGVVSIHVTDAADEPMRIVGEVCAVAGRGLQGDRCHERKGFYSYHSGPEREETLIEEETIEVLRRDHDLELASGETKRNVVTRGTPLIHLVGREFRVGEAILRSVEPCEYLVNVTGKRSLLPSLIHRGGLHAQVLASGEIPTGDEIEAVR